MFRLGLGTVSDPYWANTVSLLHFDGSNASTTFTDSRGLRTWTAFGNAQISTAQKVFGTGSGLFDGNGDYIRTANSTDYQFGTGGFTIECRVRFASLTGDQNFLAFSTASGPVQFMHTSAGNLAVYGQTSFVITQPWTPTLNTWYGVAFVRSGNSWYLFVDGTQLGTTVTDTRTLAAPNHANGIMIGAEVTAPSQFINAYIDEMRITKGVGRYTANYTLATSAFPNG